MPLPVPGEAPSGVVPNQVGNVAAMFEQVWSRLSENERKTLYSAVISSGGLTVQDGGFIRSLLSNGVEPFYVGRLIFDSVIYDGIIMRRPDGTSIFFTFPVGGDPDVIAWRFRDQFGNEVVASDALTGGLAKPWIPIPTVTTLSTAIPMTTSSGYIGVQSTGLVAKQQPFVRCRALLRSESAGVGTARFSINGAPAGTTMPIASGAFGWTASQVLALPGEFYDDVTVELEVIRTNGVGSVGGALTVSQRQT